MSSKQCLWACAAVGGSQSGAAASEGSGGRGGQGGTSGALPTTRRHYSLVGPGVVTASLVTGAKLEQGGGGWVGGRVRASDQEETTLERLETARPEGLARP